MSEQTAINLLHRRFGEREFRMKDLSDEEITGLLSALDEHRATTNIGRRDRVGKRLNDMSRRTVSFEVEGGRRVVVRVAQKANTPTYGKPALYQLQPLS